MKFNKHGLVILYKEPASNVSVYTMATPHVFHSDVHYGTILGSRGTGKSMLTESLINIWNGFK